MKALGDRSVASVLKVGLDVVWFLGAAFAGILVLLFLFSLVAKPSTISALAPEVGLKGFNIERLSGGARRGVTMVLPVALDMDPYTAGALPAQPVEIKNIQADLRFPIQKGRFFSVSLAIILGLLVLGMWVVAQLRQIFGTLRDGEPFAAENAARIRRVGIGVILVELLRIGAVLFWSYSAGAIVTANGARFVPTTHITAPAILYGVVILVIAEIFREGARLREEQSLTI